MEVEERWMNVTKEASIDYALPLYGYAMPFLTVITVVANSLIVVVLSKKKMRSPTNVVLMSMALCDMFTILVPSPWFLYMYTFGNHYKPLWPVELCYAWDMMHEVIPNIFHTASIWLTLALAVQRYIFVCHPPYARKFCTMSNVYKCLVYIIALAVLQQSTKFFDTNYTTIEVSWNNQSTKVCNKSYVHWVQEYDDYYFGSYYVFRIFFVHLIPCALLVILNLLLFRTLRQAQKRRDNLLSSNQNECKKQRDSNCTTLMLVVVVSAFLFVEIPLAVVSLLHIISSVVYEFLDYNKANKLILVTNFLMTLSYPINFGIYCGMSRQFRETFQELFMRSTPNARNGSSRYSIVNGPRTCTNETVL